MVLRDGTMRGGGGFYYTVGSYTCSGGKWKGEMTSQEHSPIAGTYPWARKVMSIGFTGTYFDDGAELKQPHWPASNPFDSNQPTGCCSRIESVYPNEADQRGGRNSQRVARMRARWTTGLVFRYTQGMG